MDPNFKAIVSMLPLAFSVLALLVSYKSYRVSKHAYEHNKNTFNISNTNTLLGHLKINEFNGQKVNANFRLVNHGEKNITLEKIVLSGRGQSSFGDDFGVMHDIFSSDGPRVICGGKEHNFEAKFLVGSGKLNKLNLVANVTGVDAHHLEFSASVPVEVKFC